MSGRPPKVSAEHVRQIREWWRLKRSIPTRRQMCEKYGIHESTLIQIAHGVIRKTVE